MSGGRLTSDKADAVTSHRSPLVLGSSDCRLHSDMVPNLHWCQLIAHWWHTHRQTHRPMTTSAKRAFRCSAPAVWNSLPTTALNRDSVIVLKSRLWYDIRCYFNMHSKADIPLLPGFLFFLCSLTCCLALVPLKLRLHGAIQICLLLLFFKAHQHKFALTISATRQT